LRPAEDRKRLDALVVVGDPVDHGAAVTAKLLRRHVATSGLVHGNPPPATVMIARPRASPHSGRRLTFRPRPSLNLVKRKAPSCAPETPTPPRHPGPKTGRHRPPAPARRKSTASWP